jgi:hypothetical protein
MAMPRSQLNLAKEDGEISSEDDTVDATMLPPG